MNDCYLRGWEEIEALFPMYAPETVRKKYGREMIQNGWVMKSTESYAHKKGFKRRPGVWSFESLVKTFISKKIASLGVYMTFRTILFLKFFWFGNLYFSL